ncbi:MAG TPA: hypothetical protein VFC00_40595 [Micromonosporaceae bacterium]|nr:hypothetical protein [Micromonosporaceae bacterium]
MNYNYVDIHRTITEGLGLRRMFAWLVQIMTEVCEGRRQLAAMRHPLGFICFPVERREIDGVCVHLWDAELVTGTPPTTSLVHAHSWDLVSFVLFGEVYNEEVHVADDHVEPMSRVFEVRSSGDIDELWATPRLVRETTRATHIHPGGASYTLPAGSFHTTMVQPGQAAATIALGSNRLGSRDLSLGPVDGTTHRIRRLRCDQQETIKAARTVARHAMVGNALRDGGRGL